MSQLKKILHEIHRRSLWQVLSIYLGAAWAILAVSDTLTGALGLPDWATSLALYLLVVGLPIVLATAFVQGGVRGSGPEEAAKTRAAEDVPRPSDDPSGSEERAGSLLTWRNALLGGVAAFALLGVASGGWMAMRALGIGPVGTLVATGAIESRDRILVAEFENGTADSLLGAMTSEVLRIDLAQSRVVRLVEPALIADARSRMGLDPAAPLTEERALELAQREGIPIVLTGEVGSAGGGYILLAQIRAPGSGAVLASARETASDSSEILPTIDRLSGRLRERIGESLPALRSEPPLARVTTGSLQALRAYTLAAAAFDADEVDRTIALLRDAIRLDPEFAMAWRKLAVQYGNRGETARAIEASTRAHELGERLTDRERLLAAAYFHGSVRGDFERSVVAYRNLLDIQPDEWIALNNLAWTERWLRNYSAAEEAAHLGTVARDSTQPGHWEHLTLARFEQGRLDEAEATLEIGRTHLPDNGSLRWIAGMLAAARQRWDEADSHFVALSESHPARTLWTDHSRGAIAAVRGRLAEAARLHGDAADDYWRDEIWGEAIMVALTDVDFEAIVLRDSDAAHERLQAMLRRFPPGDVPALDRPAHALAESFARAGRPERARSLLDAYESDVDPDLRARFEHLGDRARATILLAEGRFDEAAELFRAADVGHCVTCVLPGLARAHAGAGRRDSAIATYERYLAAPHPYRLFVDQVHLGPTYEELARLYDEAGDHDRGSTYYARLIELWDGADAALQPRVDAARRRLAEIEAGTEG